MRPQLNLTNLTNSDLRSVLRSASPCFIRQYPGWDFFLMPNGERLQVFQLARQKGADIEALRIAAAEQGGPGRAAILTVRGPVVVLIALAVGPDGEDDLELDFGDICEDGEITWRDCGRSLNRTLRDRAAVSAAVN